MILVKEKLNFKDTIHDMGIPEEKISENTLELYSQTNEFDILYDKIKAALSRKKYSLQFMRNIMHCLDEAFSNAIIWGNKNDPNKKIIVKYYVTKEFCAVSVQDQGSGFDVYDLVNGVVDNGSIYNSIRGLYFINNYVDKVFFNKVGNTIVMIKNNNVNC